MSLQLLCLLKLSPVKAYNTTNADDFEYLVRRTLNRLKALHLDDSYRANLLRELFNKYCKLGYETFVVKTINLMKSEKVTIYWSDGLMYSCRSGNLSLVKRMLRQAKSIYRSDTWNTGLYHACCSGNMDIVELMISCGANDWEHGFRGACLNGNKTIIECMLNNSKVKYHTVKEKITPPYYWPLGFVNALSSGKEDTINYLLTKFTPDADDANRYFIAACRSGNIPLMESMESMVKQKLEVSPKTAKMSQPDYLEALYSACRSGSYTAVQYILKRRDVEEHDDLTTYEVSRCLDESAVGHCKEMIEYCLIRLKGEIDIGKYLEQLWDTDDISIIELFTSNGVIVTKDHVESSITFGHLNVINYFLDRLLAS